MLSSSSVSLVFCKAIVTKVPSKPCLLSDISMSTLELIEYEGETKFHPVTDMNLKQEDDFLDLDE